MGWVGAIEASVAAGGPIDVRAAAQASGLTVRSVSRRASREGWLRLYPGVIAVPGTTLDGRTWARAAVLHCTGLTGDPPRDVAALAGGSALALLGIQRSYPTRTRVVVHASRVVRPRPHLSVARSRLLVPGDVGEREGVPILTGERLVCDLAAVRDRSPLRAATLDLVKAGVVDLDRLPLFVARHPTFPGRQVLRQVLADLLGAGRSDSRFEFDLRAGLTSEGIPLDRGQVPFPGPGPGPGNIHIDLGIASIRFGIEADSFTFHAARQDLDRDAERANLIASAGDDWRVMHATWSTLGRSWDRFVEQVREVVSQQSRRHLGRPWPRPADIAT